MNPAASGAIYRPVACIECHPDNAGNTTHSNGTVDVTFVAATGANLGSYTATRVQGNGTSTPTTCATYCHGATMGAGYTGSVGLNWAWNGAAATCGSCHGFPPTVSHTGVTAAATECNRCHADTVNLDGTINVAGGKHINGQLDGGGEPATGGTSCGGCHTAYFDAMTASPLAKVSRHGLGSDVPQDGAYTGPGLPRRVGPARQPHLHLDVPRRPPAHAHQPGGDDPREQRVLRRHHPGHPRRRFGDARRGRRHRDAEPGQDRLRLDPQRGGLCASCHLSPLVANGITVSAATFGASAHDFVTNSVGATNYTWSYALHDGSSFARNCTKCHASRAEGNTPTTSTTVSVHFSDTDLNLLAGTTNPAGSAANFACYNCHGSTATPAAGVQGNRSGKDIQTLIAKGAVAGGSGHPSNADTIHNSATEFANAAFGNALGVAAGAGQRHASCLDCHDPHEAKSGTHVQGTAFAGPPLQGAWGVALGTLAAWTAPGTGNFTKKTLAAGTDLEASLCFKCHSSYYGTLPTSALVEPGLHRDRPGQGVQSGQRLLPPGTGIQFGDDRKHDQPHFPVDDGEPDDLHRLPRIQRHHGCAGTARIGEQVHPQGTQHDLEQRVEPHGCDRVHADGNLLPELPRQQFRELTFPRSRQGRAHDRMLQLPCRHTSWWTSRRDSEPWRRHDPHRSHGVGRGSALLAGRGRRSPVPQELSGHEDDELGEEQLRLQRDQPLVPRRIDCRVLRHGPWLEPSPPHPSDGDRLLASIE